MIVLTLRANYLPVYLKQLWRGFFTPTSLKSHTRPRQTETGTSNFLCQMMRIEDVTIQLKLSRDLLVKASAPYHKYNFLYRSSRSQMFFK